MLAQLDIAMGNTVALARHPEITPDPNKEASFDPNLGFKKGRKERVMIATPEEMESAKLPLADRDYCAHLLLKYRACRSDHFPWVFKCHYEKHDFLHCEHEDYILRMKEYERERRLLERQQRINKRQAAA